MTTGRKGFTLVELAVVLAIVAILSATSVMVVRQPLAASQRQFLLEKVRSFDSLARQRARSGEPVGLTFDLRKQELAVVDRRSGEEIQKVNADGRMRLHVVTQRALSHGSAANVAYDRYGCSHSFAIALSAEETPDKWMLVLGMTGQVYFEQSKVIVDEVLRRERSVPD